MLARAGREPPAAARVLALMLVVAAAAAALSALAPMTPQAPVALHRAEALLGVVLVALVRSLPRRPVLHLGCVGLVAGVTAGIAAAATPAGTAGSVVSCVWVPLYAAFFFGRRAARGYVAGTAAALAAALAVNPFPGAVHVWALVVLTTAVAVEAVATTVGRLAEQATTDPLTGVLNREGLRRAAGRVLASAAPGAPVTAVVIDLDGFKQVNDRRGHAAGDALLAGTASAWRDALRAGDVLARLGGDEFALLLPATAGDDAVQLTGRLRERSPSGWSCGVATTTSLVALGDLLAEADVDLYAAKARRRAARVPAQRGGEGAALTI